MMGYSVDGVMGYKIYILELKEIVIGVNCLFNEVIPTYTEEYFAELNKIKIETVEDSSTVLNFEYLVMWTTSRYWTRVTTLWYCFGIILYSIGGIGAL